MSKKVAVITGTSTGIGLSALLQFAKQGWRTIGTVRDASKKDAILKIASDQGVPTTNIEIVALNADKPDAGKVIEEIIKKEGHIDVLVNNAGVGYNGALESYSEEDVRHQYEVNVFGPIRLMQAVLPSMRARKSGRIINISSVVGIASFPFVSLYSSTKFALESLTQALRQEVASFGVQAIVIEPGFTKTSFGTAMNELTGRRPVPDDPYKAAHAASIAFMHESLEKASVPADVVAGTIWKAATDEKPQFRYQCTPGDAGMAAAILKDPTGLNIPGKTE
jgi:NAD(P)-dependent dehydrogenase (short-subunit alcohol dehydrogenase family)